MALKPLNSVGGFSVGEIPANVILANADFVSNNITVQKVANLGPVSNVIITGGSANQYLQTDGFGNLTWTTADTSRIANGTSNVSIPDANGNVNTSVGGNANVFVVTSTGANVAGTLNATGNLIVANANLGNLATANFVNVASNTITSNLTVNLELAGNTANFSGNVVVPNLTINLELAGNTANFSGNIKSLNANLGNLATANYVNVASNLVTSNATINLELAGNTANFSGNITSLNANLGNLATANYVNIASNLVTSNATINLELAGNTANFTGNIAAANANLGNLATANYVNIASNLVTSNATINLELAGNTANFSGNITALNANLGNLATANYVNVSQAINGNLANFSGNVVAPNLTVNLELQANTANFDGNVVMDNWLTVSNTANVGNLRTDNLLYANGAPWDLQEAAGANTEIQFNDGNDNFAASANFTFNSATNVLTVNGNANVTNTLITPNVNSGTGNLTLTSNGFSTVYDNTGNVTFPAGGTVTVGTLVGNVQANINITAPNTTILFSDNGLVDGSNAFTFNKLSNLVTLNGNLQTNNANLGNLAYANYINVASNLISNNVTVNLELAGNTANFSGNVIVPNLSVNLELAGNTANFSGNIKSLNANLGNLATANYVNVASNLVSNNVTVNLELAGNTANFSGNVIVPNLTVNSALAGNTANFSGNVIVPNLSVNLELAGNTANFSGNVIVPNLSVNLELAGNTANFIGNVVLSGAQVTVNNHLAGNTANFSGNITALNANLGNLADANFIRTSELLNGNSNIVIAPNGNISLSATGAANVFVLSNVGANITGYVTANGDGTFGAVKSNTVTAQGGNLTIYAAAGNNYVELRPTGTGQVDVGNHRIENLATPVASTDAATKGYVDAAVEGLHVHAPCAAATPDTLANISVGTVTYNNGTAGVGATLVTTGSYTLIDGVNIATVGTRILVKNEVNAAHNGIYVYTNSTTLTRASDFDTPTEMAGGDFTFVQNGTIYNDTGWVMTDPVVTVGTTPVVWLQFSGAGEYSAGAGLTLTGTVFSVNVDNITTEIAGGNVVVKANAQLTTPNIGAATGTSLDLTGNLLAGNVNSNAEVTGVDFEASGNIIAANISANANLLVNNATVNLSLTGNTANFSGNVVVPNLQVNLSLAGNTANFTGAVVAQNVTANSTVFAANANVSGTTITNALTVNTSISGNTANFSGNIVVNNATVNLELAGNTANFTGNVVMPNLTVNTTLSGNVANFSGNLTAANGNLGNLITANFANIASNTITNNLTVNLELAGNTANFSGNIVAGNISTAGSGGNITGANVVSANTFSGNLEATYANATGNITGGNLVTAGVANVAQLNVTGNVTSDLLPNANLSHDLGNSTLRWDNVYAGNIDASGNLTIAGNLQSNNYTANIITANVQVNVGNTAIRHGEVTTTSVAANQTISTAPVSGITGAEWIVKGIDSTGSKYSMAIVTAVTDGSNVDYSVFGGVNLGSITGTLAVNVSGSNINLQVTPSSSNSTVWVTQYRTI